MSLLRPNCKMLRWCTFMVLVAVASSFTLSDMISERGKRQSRLSLNFPVGDDKTTSLELNGVTYVQLTGTGTGSVTVPEGVNVSCDIDLSSVNSPDTVPPLALNEITQCVNVSVMDGFTFSTYDSPGDSIAFTGPGTLYFDPDSVFFIDDTASTITAFVENSRSSFVPIIPPLAVRVVTRNSMLVLNLDPNENEVPSSSEDTIILTGAECTDLGTGQSVSYIAETLRVRQGIQVLNEVDDIDSFFVVLDQTIAGIPCLSYDINEMNRDVANSLGAGYLCIGTGAINTADTVAFYTNSTDTIDSIHQSISNMLIQYQNTTEGEIAIVGAFPPNDGTILVHLAGVDSETFSGATQIAHLDDDGNNVVQLIDRFGITLRTYTCLDRDVPFSLFNLNDLEISEADSTAAGVFDAPMGGLVVLYDPTDCRLFAYPATRSEITSIVMEGISMLPTITETTITFSSSTNSLGVSTLSANNMEVLTSSSSMSFSVGSSQFVTYQGDTVRILDTSGGSTMTVNTFSGVGSFVANTGITSLMSFTGSAPSGFSGAGTLSIDGGGRAFYTTSDSVSNLISSSTSSTSRTVDVVRTTTSTSTTTNDGVTTITTTTDATLSTAGTNFFDIPSSEFAYTLGAGGEEQVVLYRNRVLAVGNGQMVPSDASFQYFDIGDGVIQITRVISTDPTVTEVTSLFNVSSLQVFNGMGLEQVFGETDDPRVIPGGGILYRGDNGAVVYIPSTLTREFNVLSDLGVFTRTFEGIESCTYYDGSLVQVLTNNSLTTLLSPGLLLVDMDENTCFYTDDAALIMRIPAEVARILPSATQYDGTTGFVTVTSNSGDPISSFVLSSRIVQSPDGDITYVNGMITSTSVGNNVISTGVTSIVYFDGYQVITADTDSDELILPGGGLLVVDPDSGMAFYTTSSDVASTVMSTVTNAMLTLVAPDIEDPVTVDMISKLNTVEAIFGQVLTVYEGADVNLTCNAGNANPPAMFSFSTRSNLTDGFPYTTVMNTNMTMISENGINSATLLLADIELGDGEVEYRCEASNDAGTQFSSTVITVRPRAEPAIVNNFFARNAPGDLVVTAVDDPNDAVVLQPIVAPFNDGLVIDDESQLTETVSIACKAGGRPKAEITWFVSINGADRVEVDTTGNDANVTIPRPGQSVLTVALDNGNPVRFVYTCVADNGGTETVEGTAIISPIRYDLEPAGAPDQPPCSATCGVGIQEAVDTIQVSMEGTTELILSTELPIGLVKPTLSLCFSPLGECPDVTYGFVAEEFGNCSVFCGRGIRTRIVNCVETTREGTEVTTVIVDDGNCTQREDIIDAEEGPLITTEVCDAGRCPVYVYNGFGECSVTCGGGIRTRNITCLAEVIDEETGVGTFINGDIIDIEFCYNYTNAARPTTEEVCNTQPCPCRYFAESYGACDEFNCQTRRVYCSLYDPVDPSATDERWEKDEELCIAQDLIRPHTVRSCDGGICSFGRWETTALAGQPMDADGNICSEPCGKGIVEYDVTCTNTTNDTIIEEGFCNADERPDEQRNCFLRNCPGKCWVEPRICVAIKNAGQCKNERLFELVQHCCISCPLQATPIPPLDDGMTEDDGGSGAP